MVKQKSVALRGYVALKCSFKQTESGSVYRRAVADFLSHVGTAKANFDRILGSWVLEPPSIMFYLSLYGSKKSVNQIVDY